MSVYVVRCGNILIAVIPSRVSNALDKARRHAYRWLDTSRFSALDIRGTWQKRDGQRRLLVADTAVTVDMIRENETYHLPST